MPFPQMEHGFDKAHPGQSRAAVDNRMGASYGCQLSPVASPRCAVATMKVLSPLQSLDLFRLRRPRREKPVGRFSGAVPRALILPPGYFGATYAPGHGLIAGEKVERGCGIPKSSKVKLPPWQDGI